MHREFVYIWYYFEVQLRQIFWYWILGMAIGSLVSVFAKDRIHGLFSDMKGKKWGLLGIVPACFLGIASPLCMYGTIPIAASFSKQGMREDWLAAFMMASILLNPQLIIYSAALGATALAVRIVTCFLCGCAALACVRVYSDMQAACQFVNGCCKAGFPAFKHIEVNNAAAGLKAASTIPALQEMVAAVWLFRYAGAVLPEQAIDTTLFQFEGEIG